MDQTLAEVAPTRSLDSASIARTSGSIRARFADQRSEIADGSLPPTHSASSVKTLHPAPPCSRVFRMAPPGDTSCFRESSTVCRRVSTSRTSSLPLPRGELLNFIGRGDTRRV